MTVHNAGGVSQAVPCVLVKKLLLLHRTWQVTDEDGAARSWEVRVKRCSNLNDARPELREGKATITKRRIKRTEGELKRKGKEAAAREKETRNAENKDPL